MLKEFYITQKEPNIRKRYFSDGYFDLFVWYYQNTDRIKGFQLCYDVGYNEHSLTWTMENGYSFTKIDSGDSAYFQASPILVEGDIFPAEQILVKLIAVSQNIGNEISGLIISKIAEYGNIDLIKLNS
jgi:hypothetical protein